MSLSSRPPAVKGSFDVRLHGAGEVNVARCAVVRHCSTMQGMHFRMMNSTRSASPLIVSFGGARSMKKTGRRIGWPVVLDHRKLRF